MNKKYTYADAVPRTLQPLELRIDFCQPELTGENFPYLGHLRLEGLSHTILCLLEEHQQFKYFSYSIHAYRWTQSTVMVGNFWTDRFVQTVQIQIGLLSQQSDWGHLCLPSASFF